MFTRRFLAVVTLLIVSITAPGSVLAAIEIDPRSLLSAFVSYTDLRFSSVSKSLEILTATSEAKSGEWQKMKQLLSTYQQSEEGVAVWFVRPNGEYYTVDKGFMDVKLSDRNYFPELMSGRKVIGSLVVSRSTGHRSAVIAVPLIEGGKVLGAIGASLSLDRLSEQISTMLALPPDVSFFALAPSGLTALHSKTERHFLDPGKLGSETLKKSAAEMLSKNSGEVAYMYENAAKRAIFRTSRLTQWKFAISLSGAR